MTHGNNLFSSEVGKQHPDVYSESDVGHFCSIRSSDSAFDSQQVASCRVTLASVCFMVNGDESDGIKGTPE